MSFYCDIVLLVILASSIAFYKSLYLKIPLFASLYPTFILCAYKYGLPMRGILGINRDYFFPDVQNLAFYTACLAYAVLAIALIPIRKLDIKFVRLKLSYPIRLILPFAFLIFSILSYPRAFGIELGIQSGSISLVISVLILASKKKRFEIPALIHIAFLCFMILMGERVDAILALFIHFLIKGENEGELNISLSKSLLSILALFVMATYIDMTRAGLDFNFLYIIFSFINQQTAVDVCYVYLTGADYYLSTGTNPELIYNAVLGVFPGSYGGVLSEYNYTIFLNKHVLENPGGGLYYTEGLIIFGVVGVAIYAIYLAFLIKFFYRRKDIYGTLGFLIVFVMQLRMQWYGLLYIYKPLLILMFVGLLYIYYTKKKDKKNEHLSGLEQQ